jgi:energy-coupling factor transport system permease protein
MAVLKFQTVERESLFTRLDFRPKLFMIIVITTVALVWESPLMLATLAGCIIIACLLAGMRMSYLRLVVSVMIPFYILLLITHGFFNVDQVMALTGKTQDELNIILRFPDQWFLVGGGKMSLEGFLYGINVICKTLALTMIIPLGIFTTEVDNMIVGMVKARVPYKIAFIFSSTLRFFPLLFQEIQNIIEAQRLRGLAMEKMGPIKRVSVYAKVAIPLILGAMVKSQQLEVVLQSKAFSGSSDRTYLHESILGKADYLLMAFFTLFLVASILLYFGFNIGKFGGPL